MTDESKEFPYCPTMPAKLLTRRIKNGNYRFQDGELEKKCGCCGTYWPADTELYYVNRAELSSYCRACNVEHGMRCRAKPPMPVALPMWPVPSAL